MTTSDFYTILNLHPGAALADVRTAYRKVALRVHPDKGGTAKDFHSVALAFEALSNAAARAVDHDLHSAVSPAAAAGKSGSSRRSWTRPSNTGKRAPNSSRGTFKCSRTLVDKALGQLRAVLQFMDAQQRRACILGMTAHVRSALLSFMKQFPKTNAGLTTDTTHDLTTMRVRKPHVRSSFSGVRAAGLWTMKTVPRTKYKVQVYANALRLYTSEQTEVELAIEHHITLVRIKSAIVAECNANPVYWQDPQRLIQICTSIVQQCGIPEEKLGLRVFAVIKAGGLLAHNCRITTPVAPLAKALETYCRIRRARATSWDAFRAEWISLLCAKRFTREVAEAMVDRKRETTLDLRLKQAQCMVERAMAQHKRKATATSRSRVEKSKRRHIERAEEHGSGAKRSCVAQRCGGG